MNECAGCEYQLEDGTCGAFECYGLDCAPLPCELNEGDKRDS